MLKITRVEIPIAGLPRQFDGFRIAHISDFHNDKRWERVAQAVEAGAPHMIAVTGDLIDRRRQGMDRAVKLIRALTAVAPVYYVTGNHESLTPEFPALERELAAAGVILLRDKAAHILREGEGIKIVGLDDPNFTQRNLPLEDRLALTRKKLGTLIEEGEVSVVLSHHPEYFASYCAAGASLVLAGHAHGGQWRLPMGLYAPGQGVFPRYTAGVYTDSKTQMYVSRGIGNSACALRINNPPELALLTLTPKFV